VVSDVEFAALYKACRNDPANLNHLYTLVGRMISTTIALQEQVKSLEDQVAKYAHTHVPTQQHDL